MNKFLKDYSNKRANKQVEGYWWSKDNPKYIKPVPNILTEDDAQTIHGLILNKESHASKRAYMGCSDSRITGETLGNLEYETTEWIWPGDFASHYVLEHKVKPSDEFLKYIGYYE